MLSLLKLKSIIIIIARLEMHPESVRRMENGLEPLRTADKEWVARTAR